MRERQRDRERDRETERETERDRQRDRERDREVVFLFLIAFFPFYVSPKDLLNYC